MAAVTFSATEIDTFRTAMLTNPGVLELRIGDRLYKFETLKAMEERLAYMERNIVGGATGGTRYASTSKGF
jgi:hypothetical protein